MKTEADFIRFAKENRLRYFRAEDNTPVVIARPRRGSARGLMAWNRPGRCVLVVCDVPPLRSRSLGQTVARTCGSVEMLQGAPPGDWVAEFDSDKALDVAKALGMVKKRRRRPDELDT